MSCNEWEAGTIVLPSATAAGFRDAMKGAANAYRKRLYEHAQRFWNDLPGSYRRDREQYQRAVSAFLEGNGPKRDEGEYRSAGLPDPKLPRWPGIKWDGDDFNSLRGDLDQLLRAVTRKFAEVEREGYNGTKHVFRESVECKPHRVLEKDVVALVGKTTGTKFRIQCGEPSISFEGRKVSWDVPGNNHARDRGRNHPLARSFFELLNRTSWTRGSGGVIVGNDEYNQDSTAEGGGGNYTISQYGPDRLVRRARPGARRMTGAR